MLLIRNSCQCFVIKSLQDYLSLETYAPFFFLNYQKPQDTDSSGKWDVLKDDYMMGANLKDWDKADNSDSDAADGEESMEADDFLSDDD